MALDYQSLFTSVSGYASLGMSNNQLLKLALLQSIANTVAPTMPTDFQSLISQQNSAGYAAVTSGNLGEVLELALLNIIASALGGGGSPTVGGIVFGNYGGAQPTPSPLPTLNTVFVDTSGGQLWAYNATANTWTELIA